MSTDVSEVCAASIVRAMMMEAALIYFVNIVSNIHTKFYISRCMVKNSTAKHQARKVLE
jgi:hypothetical protein